MSVTGMFQVKKGEKNIYFYWHTDVKILKKALQNCLSFYLT